ncbi:TPA: cysteine peptidase family C39 domain-containing protein, partial [Enterococcus faecium]
MIKSFPFVQQQDEKDCGVACLSMILKYFKTDIPIHKLRDLSGTDLEGTSAFGLKKTFEKLSFDCVAIQADSEIWKERDLILPLIAHILVDNSYMHYVVIYKTKGNVLWIADPANGKNRK